MATRLELMRELRALSRRSRWELWMLLQDAAEKLDSAQLGSLVDDGLARAERADDVTVMFEHYRRQCLEVARRMTTRRPRSE